MHFPGCIQSANLPSFKSIFCGAGETFGTSMEFTSPFRSAAMITSRHGEVMGAFNFQPLGSSWKNAANALLPSAFSIIPL